MKNLNKGYHPSLIKKKKQVFNSYNSFIRYKLNKEI